VFDWEGFAPHKGPHPSAFDICDTGLILSTDYRQYSGHVDGKPVFKGVVRHYNRVEKSSIQLGKKEKKEKRINHFLRRLKGEN